MVEVSRGEHTLCRAERVSLLFSDYLPYTRSCASLSHIGNGAQWNFLYVKNTEDISDMPSALLSYNIYIYHHN